MNRVTKSVDVMLAAFRSVNGQSLRGVSFGYAEGSLEKLFLDFGAVVLEISADENDDSVDVTSVSVNSTPSKAGHEGPRRDVWSEFIGRPLGWGWVTTNQQGYRDGLLLSFGDGNIAPSLIINIVASSIKVATISSFI